jgi:adenylyltransferase/sulfurtransferase
MLVPEITPVEFAALAEQGEAPVLLDVREDWELAIARLEGVIHIPMGQLPDRLGELSRDADIVVMCRSGGRSATVVRFLQHQGFSRVRNLAGGIAAWGETLDPSLPSY